MKLTYRVFVLTALASVVLGCQSPESNDSGNNPTNPTNPTGTDLTLGDASKVTAVTAVAPSNLVASGATVFPESVDDLWTLGQEILGSKTPAEEQALSAARDAALTGSALEVLSEIRNEVMETATAAFLTEKSYTKQVSLASDSIGETFTLSKATAELAVKASTFDDKAISGDASNLKALTASAKASVDVALNTDSDVAQDSFLRDAKVRVNFGTDALAKATQQGDFTSTGTGTVTGTFAYGINASWGFSVNKNGTGGKIILTASSSYKNSTTVSAPVTSVDAVATGEDFFESDQAVTVTVAVYNDANVLQKSFSYDSTIADLFSSAVPLTGLE